MPSRFRWRQYGRKRGAAKTAKAAGGHIRRARLALGYTQIALGTRLGLTGRAVYRWERGESGPSRHHRHALLEVVRGANPAVHAELAAAFVELYPAKAGRSKRGAELAAPAPRPPPDPGALDRSLVDLADALDVAPRRARAFARAVLRAVAAARYTLDEAAAHLDAALERSGPATDLDPRASAS